MIQYHLLFQNVVNNIQNEGRYRKFVSLLRGVNNFPKVVNDDSGEEVVMWCTNDYLGMSMNNDVIKAAHSATTLHGVGSGGTRNIGGNHPSIVALEKEVADLHNKDAALIFTSGYVANESTLSAFAEVMPNLVFFSDKLNHASMIAGIRHSKAEKKIYNHLDMNHLEELLQSVDINRPKVIAFESVYSMEGSISPIQEICRLAKKYNALTYIDEVHGVGLYGKHGAGVARMLGVDDQIDIIQGNFAKAYGVMGGYITGNKTVIDAIRLVASGFIFTTSLPPVITEAIIASIRHLKYSEAKRIRHQDVVSKVKSQLLMAGIRVLSTDSHIIPILIGNPVKAAMVSKMLLDDYNIFVQHINFPTVPKGTERLRITPTPYHTDNMIEEFVNSVVNVFKKLDISLDLKQVA